MQQRFRKQLNLNTNSVKRDSKISQIAKLFILRMQKLQISAVNIMNSAIELILMKKLNRTIRQTIFITFKTKIDSVIKFKNSD